MEKDEKKFSGFIPPVSNYFRMPTEWINISAKITNLAELKIVQYVLRHTWGFHEYDGKPKPITIDEFMHGRKRADGTRMDEGTGLSEQSVRNGIEKALEDGYLVCEVDDTDRARIKKSYALKMTFSELEVKDLDPENRGLEFRPQRSKSYTPEVKDLDPRGQRFRPRSEKETLERNSKKNTRERKNATSQQNPNVSADQEATHSSIPASLSQSQNSSFSSSKLEEEVSLSEEEEVIYGYACQTIFKAKPPRKTAKLKGECAEIAKHTQTVEQFISLVRFVRALPYIQGQIHLKNLVNELNGWLQTQPLADLPVQAGTRLSSYDDDDYEDDTFYPARENTLLI